VTHPLRLLIITAIAAASLAGPAHGWGPHAASLAKLKVQPAEPTVQDAVTISFRSKRRLPAHYHYELLLTVLNKGSQKDCATIVTKRRTRPVGKGRLVVFRAAPRDDALSDDTKWCQGEATAIVTTGRNGDKTGNTGTFIGTTDFVIAPAP
jgi:hypothetical protein